MKYLAILFLTIVLIGCAERHTSQMTYNYDLPNELKDCQIYRLQSETISPDIIVVRCGNIPTTSTTYQEGRAQRHVITIDGEKYQKVN